MKELKSYYRFSGRNLDIQNIFPNISLFTFLLLTHSNCLLLLLKYSNCPLLRLSFPCRFACRGFYLVFSFYPIEPESSTLLTLAVDSASLLTLAVQDCYKTMDGGKTAVPLVLVSLFCTTFPR